jgi:tetratricopeptide (TPR) repeat protein
VLDLEPHHAWTQLLLGQVLTEQGNWQEGLTFLNQAAANRSTEKGARLARAEALRRMQRVKEAEADLSALAGLGDDQSAPDTFVEELLRQEVGKTARLNRAWALGRRQGPRAILGELEQIARDYPKAEDAWRLLGRTQALAGDFRPAVVSFRRAVQLKPDSVPAHFFLGVALLEIGERTEAMACFRRVMELQPGHGMSHYYLGLCLRQDHRGEAALEELRSAARYLPHSLQALSALADLLLQTGRSNEAVEVLQRALRLKPDDPNLKKLLQEAGRKK